MKTKSLPLFLLVVFVTALVVVSAAVPAALAQGADSSSIVTTLTDAATPLIVKLAAAHPIIVTILAAMAFIGSIAKPIVTAVEIYVRNSPSTADDATLAKVEHSAAWRVFAWLLDFFTRIKIGPQFTAKPGASEPTA